jgi:hypothetical protein
VSRQTYKDFELLVVHDGPIEAETRKILDAWDDRGLDIVAFGLTEQSGYQCVPKNHATYLARGDYIAYLDDDNEWTPDHLEVLVAAIEEGTVWPDFVYGRRMYVIDPGCETDLKLDTGPSPHVPWTEGAKQQLAAGPEWNFIDTSDALIAKGALWRLQLATDNMWNETLRRVADWEMFCRGVFFADWRGQDVDKVVQVYHWHGKNVQLVRPMAEIPQLKRASEVS